MQREPASSPTAPGQGVADRIELPGGCYAFNFIGMWAVYDDRNQRIAILRGEDEARALATALAEAAASGTEAS